jgi:hypothetical protein
MALASPPPTPKRDAGWQHTVVRVPLGVRGRDPHYAEGVRTLRRVERWLAEHHRPLALFDRFDRPKSEVVSVMFPADAPGTVLAFRGFLAELGLSASLVQTRVRPNDCLRTTAPERWYAAQTG